MAMAKTQMQEISKNDTIQDVLDRYPGKAQKLAQIMTNAGLHCVGCNASTFETLEEGTASHGIDAQVLDALVKDMNRIINEKVSVKAVAVTKVAADKIQELLKKEKKVGYGLKISVGNGGCSGYQYGLEFEKEAKEGDIFTESKGVKVFYSVDDAEKISGSEVDYIDGLQGAGFKINNPNVTKSCKCGNSVGF